MLRITTLMDNTCEDIKMEGEHGLSFFIEFHGSTLIFDTGKTGLFIDNARKLGIELSRAQALIVSHGHYDHGGGVRALYEQSFFRGPLWVGAGFFDAKWSLDPTGPRFAGLDFDETYIRQKDCVVHLFSPRTEKTAVREVLPGIYAVNGFPRIHSIETISPRFVVDRENQRIPDDFSDEVCVAIPLPEGTVVILGCAHPGLMNMLSAVRDVFEKPILAVLGGSHLVEAEQQRLDESIRFLKDSGCTLAALGHCTGAVAIEALRTRLPSYRPLHVGAQFIIKESIFS